MTAEAQVGGTVKTAKARRQGAGMVRLSQRDIDALLLCAEHHAVPHDLLGETLRVSQGSLRQLTSRWRRAGYVATGHLGPGPAWYWLTQYGMTATGLRFPATRPALGRLAHYRAILAARLWLTSTEAWADGQAWWHSERRLLAEHPKSRGGHIPDAEVHWPGIDGGQYADQIWAIEVELTAKEKERTVRIMTGLLTPMRYATVVYLTSPTARPTVLRAVASLPAADRSRVAVRDLPANAFNPDWPQ